MISSVSIIKCLNDFGVPSSNFLSTEMRTVCIVGCASAPLAVCIEDGRVSELQSRLLQLVAVTIGLAHVTYGAILP